MKLFDDFLRTDSKCAEHGEAEFAFINRSARPRDARIREVLEQWFAEYPAQHQSELKRRLQSGKSGQSYESACFELSLHALLKRLHCKVEVHPELPGVSRRPEFSVTASDGRTFIVEAILAGGQSDAERALSRLKETVYDVLNRRIVSANFFVTVTIHGTPKAQPSGRTIAAFVQSKLAAEDPDTVAANYNKLGHASLPRWTFEVDDGCSIEFSPISRKQECRGTYAERPIGAICEGACFIDDVTPIREAILEKADRYGKMDCPYVVAVNLMSPTIDNDDVVQALTGSDPLWSRERAKQVSAVLLASWLMPISAAHAPIRLFRNPSAARQYSGALTTLPQGFSEEGGIRMDKGRSLGDIYGLPPGWPRQEGDG